ncbi:PilZ domain-containing protein [Sphingomonas aracearum]|uniref:PilZ domain-containing protein n=1 Tax=Sphingomonas aracearum TaxID=2283317 RepID=UPI0015F0E974|nr:PilZ domain-containing protein [Sphingomonas aracearum]
MADEPRPRREKRRKVFQPARIGSGSEWLRAHLLDISSAGALVYCEEAQAAPARLLVEAAECDLGHATIVWRRGNRLGIRFERPLDEPTLQRVELYPDGICAQLGDAPPLR